MDSIFCFTRVSRATLAALSRRVKTSSRKGLLQARVIHFFIMASLNKLAIRGIRSFDDKNIAVIEFFSPVTVIVGHNGSGKTVSVSA